MQLVLAAVGAFLFFASFPTWAAEPAVTDAEKAKVAALVAQLAAEEFETRESAEAALEDLGERFYPLVCEFHRNAEDPEVRTRLTRALMSLAPLRAAVERTTVNATLRSVHDWAVVVVNGAPSAEANPGIALEYRWRQTAGPRLDSLRAFKNDRIEFITHAPGTYAFELIVAEGKRVSPPVKVSVVVEYAPTVAEHDKAKAVLNELIQTDEKGIELFSPAREAPVGALNKAIWHGQMFIFREWTLEKNNNSRE